MRPDAIQYYRNLIKKNIAVIKSGECTEALIPSMKKRIREQLEIVRKLRRNEPNAEKVFYVQKSRNIVLAHTFFDVAEKFSKYRSMINEVRK